MVTSCGYEWLCLFILKYFVAFDLQINKKLEWWCSIQYDWRSLYVSSIEFTQMQTHEKRACSVSVVVLIQSTVNFVKVKWKYWSESNGRYGRPVKKTTDILTFCPSNIGNSYIVDCCLKFCEEIKSSYSIHFNGSLVTIFIETCTLKYISVCVVPRDLILVTPCITHARVG